MATYLTDQEVKQTCADIEKYLLGREEIEKVDDVFRSSKLANAFQIGLWSTRPSNEFRVKLEEDMKEIWPKLRFAFLYYCKDNTFMKDAD